jgi:Ca2+-binding EF-hand superfamily protein
MVENMLQRMDTNKDGKISKEEAKGPLANSFERFDQNKDGYLDRKELERVAEQFITAQRANAGKGGKKAGPQDGAQTRQNLVDFDSLDRNADGRLTREELKGTAYEAVFDQIDTNKDGKIDKKEFEAYQQKQAEKDKGSSK